MGLLPCSPYINPLKKKQKKIRGKGVICSPRAVYGIPPSFTTNHILQVFLLPLSVSLQRSNLTEFGSRIFEHNFLKQKYDLLMVPL